MKLSLTFEVVMYTPRLEAAITFPTDTKLQAKIVRWSPGAINHW
jgi:hypothetical protein